MKRVGIVAYDYCWAMSVFLAKDFFRIVSLLEKHAEVTQSFRADIVTINGNDVISASGSKLCSEGIFDTNNHYDALIIPGIEGGGLEKAITNNSRLTDILKSITQRGIPILSFTTGAAFIAATGIANDTLLATHWAFTKKLRQMYPSSQFASHETYLVFRNISSAGSLQGCMDLLLDLVANEKGEDFAQLCAAHFLIEHPSKVKPVLSGTRNHTDEAIINIQYWIEANCAESISIQHIAVKFAFSERNLKRRFKNATSLSIVQYIQKARILKAKQLLLSTELSIKEISYAVGYQNDSFFSRLFRSETGLSPKNWKLQSLISTI
jgi:transcriptional regulator GlxA family with amidase domain